MGWVWTNLVETSIDHKFKQSLVISQRAKGAAPSSTLRHEISFLLEGNAIS